MPPAQIIGTHRLGWCLLMIGVHHFLFHDPTLGAVLHQLADYFFPPPSSFLVVLCHFPLGLAALRFAVNLARFTKTRVCTSCFGSTNFGMRPLTKSQICISCFGSANPGHLASFNSRTALRVTCWLCFPLIPSFHLFRAPRLPCRLTLAQCWTTLIRCASPMGPISRLSHPFHLPVPPFFGICCCR